MFSFKTNSDQYALTSHKLNITLISFILQLVLAMLEIILIVFYFTFPLRLNTILWAIEILSVIIILIKLVIILQNNEEEDNKIQKNFNVNDLPIFLLIFGHALLYNEITIDIYGIIFSFIILFFIIIEMWYLILNAKIIELD